MAKKIYLSPSYHGVNKNKCLHKGCYEDKHTRPIADACAKYLKASGFNVVVADAKRGVYGGRPLDANKLGVDLYVPIHTNAFSDKSVRRLVYMCYRTDGEYKKLFECVKKYAKKSYDGDIKLVQRRDLYEINVTKAMTFYCELGFHTNKKDCDTYIHDADARGKELAQGICEYYGVKFKTGEEVESKPKTEPVAAGSKKKKVVSEDGVWSKSTTKYTQKLLKTTVDSIVSGQRTNCKKYLPAVSTESWQFSALGKGSAMVKALQKHVGLKGKDVDGLMGKGSVTAMQKFLKNKKFYTGAIDGIMGYATVKAWQKYINSKF